ncbi:hypothetical protein [Priestia megaterium]|uniref:hypothetical protein n=1 Tax=Priestia megaterium TaxID=1404 RepID=UPI0011298AC5|nr:hypothetical protein [Priestia megaterium]TPF14069.1 hypothetical protein CBE78_27260 [Priestia megaterium]TPF19474.1 hypothetical protein CBE79_26965 [Priestia megaterium]
MDKEFFIQYSNQTNIDYLSFNRRGFSSLDVGIYITKDTSDFLNLFISNVFHFPVYFVLEELPLLENGTKLLEELGIEYEIEKNKKEWIIIKVENEVHLNAVITETIRVVTMGFRTIVIKGDSIDFTQLLSVGERNKAFHLNNTLEMQISTIIDLYEVGFTFHTNNEKLDTPYKLLNYMPKNYKLDEFNSDLDIK